jgi:FkbM family methyltransferase
VLRKISEMSRPLVWRLSGVLRYAPRMWRWEILSRLAADIGVTAMAVQTTDGLILTKVQDRTFLPYLAKIGSNAAHQNIVCQCKQVLKDGGTYFDIGANVGLTTIPLGGLSNVTIHAFEPDPANFRMLVTNLSINCPGHKVSLHEVALGDENGLASFEVNPSNPGDNRLAGSGYAAMGEDSWPRIQVPVRRLDDLIDTFDKPLVIKIDVQGAEARVIGGAPRTFGEADLIFLEWYPYALARAGGDPGQVISLISTFNRASITAGEGENEPGWRSGREVANQMHALLTESKNPFTYFDVVAVRR